MNRPLPLSLALSLAFCSPAALALGLGGINVKSELNQPLQAEIPVYVTSPAEAESLRVELAAAAEFTRVGLDIGDLAVPIEFEVGKNARGEPVIQVRSAQPVREPTLTFLVEVNWSNGRFLREYSVLLEPPVTVPVTAPSAPPVTQAPAASIAPIEDSAPIEPEPIAEPEPLPEPPVAETPAVSEPVSEPVAEPVSEPPPSIAAVPEEESPVDEQPPAEASPEPVVDEAPPAEVVEPEPAPVAAPPVPSASEYGPIAGGETLWEIANTTRPSSITPSQMMIALLRANPEAFYRDNVNALKRGAVLRIPGEQDAAAYAAAEAAAEILSQNQSWIESTRPSLVSDANVESSATAPGNANRPSATPGSRLELVPPASGQSTSDRPGAPGGTGDSSAARAELLRTKEALTTSQQDAAELRSRVKDLESINGNNQRLLTLKDSELKALQDRLAAAEKAAAEARKQAEAAEAAAASRPTPTSADPVVTATPDPVVATPDPIATQPPASDEPVASEDAPDSATDAAADGGVDPLASADDPVDASATDPTMDGAGEFSDENETEAEVTPLADAEPAPSLPEPVAEPFYMNKFVWAGAGLGAVLIGLFAFFGLRRRGGSNKPAVVPGTISGQFGSTIGGDSEETSLLNALAADPTDLNAHLNVLEFYYMRRNADKFEAAAEAMFAQLPDPDVPEWQGALLMGHDLCPDHPMFASGDMQSQGASDPFGLPPLDSPAPAMPAAPPAMPEDDFNFDLGIPAEPGTNTRAATTDQFDFSLLDEPKKPAPAMPPAPAPAPVPAPAKDDFSLDFELPNSMKSDQISFEMPSLDLDIDIKKSEFDSATQQMSAVKDDFLGDDAVATKIDLARAYLDMGDADGARSMLEEVMSEGSESQKTEARKLLSEIR